MTTAGYGRKYATALTNTTVDLDAEFKVPNASPGNRQLRHSGLWLISLTTTAAEIVWFRPDATAAAVGGPDCFPLRSGERVLIPWASSLSFISASGTPEIFVGGDFNASLLYA